MSHDHLLARSDCLSLHGLQGVHKPVTLLVNHDFSDMFSFHSATRASRATTDQREIYVNAFINPFNPFLDENGNGIRYQTLYHNGFPKPPTGRGGAAGPGQGQGAGQGQGGQGQGAGQAR